MTDVRLITVDDFGAAVVVINGAIIYHEDNDKGASNRYFSAHDVARRLAQALGIPFQSVALDGSQIPEDWNFEDLVRLGGIQ